MCILVIFLWMRFQNFKNVWMEEIDNKVWKWLIKKKIKHRERYYIFEIYKKTARFENQKNISLEKRKKKQTNK